VSDATDNREPSRVATELDALLDRVREDKRDLTGKNRNQVAYDCWRMFEDLTTRFKEEFAMRDRYKRQSDSWRDKALQLAIEARCPICVNGQTLDGKVCQECHGKDTASVAYDTLRIHYKILNENQERRWWQPIASAPRDGSTVFIWYAGECVRAAYLAEHHGRIPNWYLLDQWRNWGPVSDYPKFWMPLPEPPTEDK